MTHDILGHEYIVIPSIDQTLHKFVTLIITKFREVSIEHRNGCGLPTERDDCSSAHLVLSHLGLAFFLILRPFSPELVMFPDFEFWTSLGTTISLYSLLMIRNFLYFARLWLAETAFTRVYLRGSIPQTAICGVFGVSIFSYTKLTSPGAINMQ